MAESQQAMQDRYRAIILHQRELLRRCYDELIGIGGSEQSREDLLTEIEHALVILPTKES